MTGGNRSARGGKRASPDRTAVVAGREEIRRGRALRDGDLHVPVGTEQARTLVAGQRLLAAGTGGSRPVAVA